MKIEDFEILKMPAKKISETMAKENGTTTEFERAIRTAVELMPANQIEALRSFQGEDDQTAQEALEAAGHPVIARL